jgi:hypothetical protein
MNHVHDDKSLLTIEIEPALRSRIEAAAAKRGVSLRDYVIAALRHALDHHRAEQFVDESSVLTSTWSRLSVPSFSRDWDSDADAVYDDLAKG